MGRRKSRKVAKKPAQPKVPTVFDCIFCNHEKSIFCTLDKKAAIGTLKCRMCSVNFQTDIHSLSKAIDVYSDWVDECERVNRNIDKVEQDPYDDQENRYPEIDDNDEQYRDLTKIDDEDDELYRDLIDVGNKKKKDDDVPKEQRVASNGVEKRAVVEDDDDDDAGDEFEIVEKKND